MMDSIMISKEEQRRIDINKREEKYWESKEEFDWMKEKDVEKIVEKIPSPRGDSLELCSGSGMFTKRMDLSNSNKYICLDISQRLLNKLKLNLKSIEIKRGDAQKIPFKDNSFDNIYVFAGLHHLPDLNSTIVKSHEVLRNGGNFICFEPNNKCFYRFIMLKLRNLLNIYTEDEVFLNPDEVVKELNNVGFINIKVKYLTPTYKFKFIRWLYPLFVFMKIFAIIPSKYFQAFFLITAEKNKQKLVSKQLTEPLSSNIGNLGLIQNRVNLYTGKAAGNLHNNIKS